jgi:cytochrome d ubiquinol oxidase subunit II
MPDIFSQEILLAGVIVVALTLYVLTGGADYGAGVWALLARGSQGRAQRAVIGRAIAPIWEANHVWLILIVTVLFTAFPPAFALLSVRLHIPLTLLLLGIIGRGAAFAFRSHDVEAHPVHPTWDAVFGIASILTPILLGVTIGTIASGRLERSSPDFFGAFVSPWLSWFPFAVGLLALSLFAFLAATYLILETTDEHLRAGFRRRALASAGVVGVMALAVFWLAAREAPLVRYALITGVLGRTMLGLTILFGIGTIVALWRQRYVWARIAAVGEVTAILWGWALAQYPFLVPYSLTIRGAAAPPLTLKLLLGALVLGALILFPSLYYLFKVFKGRVVFGQDRQDS